MIAFYAQSYYSLLRGVACPASIPELARALGYEAVLLADRDSLAGAAEFSRAAEGAGVKAFVGVELTDREGRAALLVIRDREGYEAASALISARNLDAAFSLRAALREVPAGLCVLAGDAESARELAAVLPPDRLGVLLLRPAKTATWERGQREAARTFGLPLLAACRFVYPRAEDLQTGRLLRAIGRGELLSATAAPGPRELFLPAPRAEALFADVPEALAGTRALCARIDFAWKREKYIVPAPAVRLSEEPGRFLRRLARESLRRRGAATRAAYARLDRELAEIAHMGLAEYFLVVWDIVRHAHGAGITCVGRGSGAGSLVSYALGLTPVDPLEAGLLFERFLHRLRPDLPDLDLDIDWRRRDEVILSVYRRYGEERTAMIGAYVTFGPRLAFREAARAAGLPPREIDRMSRAIPYSAGEGSLAEALARSPRGAGIAREAPLPEALLARADCLRTIPRHLSIHPAGIVIADGPICRRVPLARAPKGIVVTQLDMHGVEDTGLIKIDLLGNRALGEIADARTLVAARRGIDLRLETVPRADAATGALCRRGNAVGCFQIESPAMRQLMAALGTTTWRELMLAVALIRPGPAAAGSKDKFIRLLHGEETPSYLHPSVARALGNTRGVLLFEEDLMRVFHEVAGRPLSEGELLRSRIKAAHGDQAALAPLEDEFTRAAEGNGVPPAAAAAIWRDLLRFAAYTYNQAHAAVFSLLAWCLTYLKAHYPPEFFCAILNNHAGMYPTRVLLAEAVREGLEVRAPSVQQATERFELEGDALRLPLTMVRELSAATRARILQARPFESFADFLARVRPAVREADNLILAGAFDWTGIERPKLRWEAARRARRTPDAVPAALPFPASYPPLPPLSLRRTMAQEFSVLGFAPSGNALALLRREAAADDLVPAAALERYDGKDVRVMGFLAAFREVPTKGGGRMAFASLQDDTGWAEVVFFGPAYRRNAARFGGGLLIAHGTVRNRFGAVHLEGHAVTPCTARDALPVMSAEEPPDDFR